MRDLVLASANLRLVSWNGSQNSNPPHPTLHDTHDSILLALVIVTEPLFSCIMQLCNDCTQRDINIFAMLGVVAVYGTGQLCNEGNVQ